MEDKYFGCEGRFSVDASHIFPQNVLIAIPLVGGCDLYCHVQSLHWNLGMLIFLLLYLQVLLVAGPTPLFGVESLNV